MCITSFFGKEGGRASWIRIVPDLESAFSSNHHTSRRHRQKSSPLQVSRRIDCCGFLLNDRRRRGLGQVLHEDEIDQEAKENALKELRWLKPAELELFKSVVEAIVMSHGRKGKIDYFRATNLGQFRSEPHAARRERVPLEAKRLSLLLHGSFRSSCSKKRGRGGADEEDEPASKMFKDLTATESQSVLDRLVELKWLQYVTVEGAEARGSHNGKSITLGIRSILDLSKYIET